MSLRGPRLEFAVGAFLLLALASLLVLALASTNGRFDLGPIGPFGFGRPCPCAIQCMYRIHRDAFPRRVQ